MKLALGPLLYYWPHQSVLDFYADMAEAPLDAVYLGETIRYRIAIESGGDLVLRRPAGGDALAPGARVTLGWPARDMNAVLWG